MEIPIEVPLIPDKSQLKNATDESITQEVETKGKGGGGGLTGLLGMEAGSDIATGKEGGGMMGGLMGGKGMGAMLGKLAVIAGGVMAVAQAVMQLEPMKAIMSMINKVIQLTLLPFVNMLFTLLKPILTSLIKLMPKWLSFWKDPSGNLMKLAEWMGERVGEFFMDLPGMILEAVGNIPNMISKATTGGLGGMANKGLTSLMMPGAGTLMSALGREIPYTGMAGSFLGGAVKEIKINLFGFGTEAEAEKTTETLKEKSGEY